jgi:hypothetical protein
LILPPPLRQITNIKYTQAFCDTREHQCETTKQNLQNCKTKLELKQYKILIQLNKSEASSMDSHAMTNIIGIGGLRT